MFMFDEPTLGQSYNPVDGNSYWKVADGGPFDKCGRQRPSQPITTGSSVIGIKFDKGILIAADNLISYGSLARFQGIERVVKINDHIAIGTGGDYADFQKLKTMIEAKTSDDLCYDDTIEIKPKSLYNWMTTVFYNKRSRFEPLWLDIIVGGVDKDDVFLGHVDLRGRSYEDDVVATGMGKHLVLPILRERVNEAKKLTQPEAEQLMRKCIEILYYRDCRAMSKYTLAIVTKDGTEIRGPLQINENWQVATMIKGF